MSDKVTTRGLIEILRCTLQAAKERLVDVDMPTHAINHSLGLIDDWLKEDRAASPRKEGTEE